MAEHAGKVYLVGSGPGDAALLTVQAQELLARAEVLVYDALVDGELLNLVPETCLKLDVGKRGGQPSTPQTEINRLLVEHCQQGKLVVRLKNGDPFIFGRAESEIKALRKTGCDYEVVPGLSSALVAPLLAGIPLTDPKLSRCFAVVTAHDPDTMNWVSLARIDTLVMLMGGRTLPELVRRLRGHGRSPDTPIAIIRYAGRANQQVWEGTLTDILAKTANESLSPCVVVVGEVVGLRKYLQPRAQRKSGQEVDRRDRETRGRGLRRERSAERDADFGVSGSAEVTERAQSNETRRQEEFHSDFALSPQSAEIIEPEDDGVRSPAERLPEPESSESVSFDAPSDVFTTSQPQPLTLESTTSTVEIPANPLPLTPYPLPLSNKTVLVTRAASQSSQFTDLLQAQGATVIEMPTLEIGPPSNWRDLDRAIAHLDDFDWLILTSTNGVDYFFDRLNAQTGDPIPATNIKIAVVGEKTAQRLARLGMQPDFIPPDFVADSLVTNFPEPLSGLRMLFPRVESGGREVLVKEFVSQGAKVREVAAYESRCPDAIAPNALDALRNQTVDVITFASSKTVQHFCQLLQQADESWQDWLDGVSIASIGPQTSKSCQDLLGRVDVEAQEYTLDGLTGAIVQWATPDSDDEVADTVLAEATEAAKEVGEVEKVEEIADTTEQDQADGN